MENINLNIYPVGDMPVLHVSQFDNGRICRVNLFDGEDAYTLEGNEVITCNIRKVDNNIVTLEVENTEGSYLDIEFTEQACACAGLNLCEIQISVNDEVIGTLNFYLSVEVSPLLGGVDSTTVIDDLEAQIEEIAAQVIGNDYYNKTEVDNLLANKADVSDLPDMSDYYNKSAVDTLLSGKVDNATLNDYYNKSSVDNLLSGKADQSTTYTKTEVNNLLATKADVSDLPDMSNYYTKSEVDNKILDIIPVNNVSGSIADFTTLISAFLVNLKANIDYDANGFSSVNLYQGTPKDFTIEQGSINQTTGADETSTTIKRTSYIDVSPNSLVLFVYSNTTSYNRSARVFFYGQNGSSDYLGTESITIQGNSTSVSFVAPNNTYFIRFHGTNVNMSYDFSVYEYPNKITINFEQTIYGGYIDYTEHKLYSTKNADGTDKDTPDIYDLTDLPTILTIVGKNSIFADSGDVEVSFKQDIQNYVDDKTSNVGRSVNLMRIAAPTESEGDTDER